MLNIHTLLAFCLQLFLQFIQSFVLKHLRHHAQKALLMCQAKLACRYALIDSFGFPVHLDFVIGMYVGRIKLQIVKRVKLMASVLFCSDVLAVCMHNFPVGGIALRKYSFW